MSRITLFSCFLLALLVFSCRKEQNPTVVNGRITDRKTGVPIEGANTIFTVARQDNGSGNTGQPSSLSNANGEFSCTLQSKYVGSEETYKMGYITKYTHSNFVNGQTNTWDVQLVPRDGFLRLKIENNTGQHDTLYSSIYSQTEDRERNGLYNGEVIKEYPLLLKKGEIYTEIFDLASSEFVQIRWGFKSPTHQIPHILTDSILVGTSNTTTFTLSY